MSVQNRVDAILHNAALDAPAKIAQLREMEADALARERMGTEALGEARSDDGEDLKIIERALLALGAGAADTGAASL